MLIFISQKQAHAQEWRRLADDLEILEANTPTYYFFNNRVVLIRTSLTRYRVGVIRSVDYGPRRGTVRGIAEASKAVLAINANFFDEKGEPLGLVVSRGITHHRLLLGGNVSTGVFEVTPQAVSIISRSVYDPRSVIEAVQAGPRLFANGKAVFGLRDTTSHTARSGVCIDDKKRLVFYASMRSISGVSLDQIKEILLSPSVHCVDALNLDGGGSAQLYVADHLPGMASDEAEIYIEGDDEVPIMLGLFPR